MGDCKLVVNNYIYDKLFERGMKTFEFKVSKLIRTKLKRGNIICHNAYMERGSGRGSYYKCIEIEFNGDVIVLREHTHDSELWDNWENPTTQEKRNLFLGVLENKLDEFYEFCIENILD